MGRSNQQRAVRGNRGFTMVEVLAALLITVMITSMVCIGVVSGLRSQQAAQFESQSQSVASLVQASLSDPVRFMQWKVDATTGAPTSSYITYKNTTLYNPVLASPDGKLQLTGIDEDNNPITLPLLNEGVYGKCSVTLTSGDASAQRQQLCPPANPTDPAHPGDVVTVSFDVSQPLAAASDGTARKSYSYSFKLLGNNVTKVSGDEA